MKIIGHRGAGGLAPENTIKAIKAGLQAGVDAVEFDVRLTSDGVFVLMHDASLVRITGEISTVNSIVYKDLQILQTYSKEPIPTLDEALEACGTVTAFIEAKGSGWAKKLALALKNRVTSPAIVVISFNHDELEEFHKMSPDVPIYMLENRHPLQAIHKASQLGYAGVDLKYFLLNPVTYYYAKYLGIDLAIYTIDTPWVMRILKFLYPGISVTTNRPDIIKK